jgi:hypothetical protein
LGSKQSKHPQLEVEPLLPNQRQEAIGQRRPFRASDLASNEKAQAKANACVDMQQRDALPLTDTMFLPPPTFQTTAPVTNTIASKKASTASQVTSWSC